MRSSETVTRIAAATLPLAGAALSVLLNLEWLPVPMALVGLLFARRAWRQSDVSARPMSIVLFACLCGTVIAGATAIWLGTQQVTHLPVRVERRVQKKQEGLKKQFEKAFSHAVLGQRSDAGEPTDMSAQRIDGGS